MTTPIRQAALDLYTPPFRYEHGYIRDANHQMVADDAGSEGSGLIATRIRGWGRIQYMDKPEQRAEALQDEMGKIVAEALNAYWNKRPKPDCAGGSPCTSCPDRQKCSYGCVRQGERW